jgi:hypothetical protein
LPQKGCCLEYCIEVALFLLSNDGNRHDGITSNDLCFFLTGPLFDLFSTPHIGRKLSPWLSSLTMGVMGGNITEPLVTTDSDSLNDLDDPEVLGCSC